MRIIMRIIIIIVVIAIYQTNYYIANISRTQNLMTFLIFLLIGLVKNQAAKKNLVSPFLN
ncbi:hypothetical protein PFDG_04734 [Plasmodium falciparum Dd2]|uniref:Uncharacterized protein n=1 Tax=Plasmodium falciparum (isolate Dd2) TaxID=57267 RepID=A0A0L7M8P0_PLAF4|nr:hypothetical protein PFDG_04734 [Plasmodium falciparum Dd2]